ncbi:MAG: sigma-70 family RNA polymerase sigma factor [Bacteroidota bacterium]
MEVLERPVTGIAKRESEFLHLYEEVFPVCAQWIRKMNGTRNDAEDIFHDALVIYFEKISSNKPEFTVSPAAYILGIVKHLWSGKFRKDVSLLSLNDLEKTVTIPEDFYPAVNTIRMLDLLERAGHQCLELLRSFYYEKLSMKELSSAMGYGSERSATVQKYKCIEKLRTSVKQKSLTYEDFFE